MLYVNKIPFFMTTSHGLKFGTSEFLLNRKTKTIIKALNHVRQIYAKRGFRARYCHVDGEFEPLCSDISEMKIELNTALNDEHVPEIERYIRTVKEDVLK
jgi:hypothetical protein